MALVMTPQAAGPSMAKTMTPAAIGAYARFAQVATPARRRLLPDAAACHWQKAAAASVLQPSQKAITMQQKAPAAAWPKQVQQTAAKARSSAEGKACSNPQRQSAPWKILCYGDSLTAGFYANGNRFAPYGRALSDTLGSFGINCEVTFCGLSGLTGKEMVRNVNADSGTMVDITFKTGRGLGKILDDDGADMVIIMVGTNDMSGSTASEILASVKALHAVCHNQGIKTIAVAPPVPPHGERRKRHELVGLMTVWAENEPSVAAFVDPEVELVPRTADSRFYDSDILHFSPAGSTALGQGLAQYVRNLVADAAKRGRSHTL
jgi:lysophospholipase L1-like esterase